MRLATDDTAALLDDSQNRGQPQARSFASLLRREERLEDMGLHFRVDADAGVAHRQHHVASRRKRLRRRASASVSVDVSRLNGQRASVGHGVPRVQGKGS